MPEEVAHSRHIRAADEQPAADDTGILYQNDNVLLYVDSVPIVNTTKA